MTLELFVFLQNEQFLREIYFDIILSRIRLKIGLF
nr:hypothetical protein pmam_116 [Pithovirus mammoth]